MAKTWSLTGAARFAREARASTTDYLLSAPSARRWERGSLQRAYQIHLAHFGNRAEAEAMLFAGMGYYRPYPTNFDDAADLVVRDEARHLTR